MVKRRLIPCLDVDNGRVVKGVRFETLREVGDPVELATRYSELGADELVFLDVTATVEGRRPPVELVERAAEELEIPFTVGGGVTSIGNHNLLMAYTHIAHDCHIGSETIFGNAATLAGHVLVEDFANIGAFSGVHQFCRVGRYAFIGGYSVVTKDALPFAKTVGNRQSAICNHKCIVMGVTP